MHYKISPAGEMIHCEGRFWGWMHVHFPSWGNHSCIVPNYRHLTHDVVSPSFFLPPCAILDQPQTEGESFNATDIKDFAASRCGFPWCRPKYIWSCIVHRKICTIYGTWCCYRSMMVAHFPVYHANTTSDIFSFGIVLETITLYVACSQRGLQKFANSVLVPKNLHPAISTCRNTR